MELFKDLQIKFYLRYIVARTAQSPHVHFLEVALRSCKKYTIFGGHLAKTIPRKLRSRGTFAQPLDSHC